MSDMPWLDQGTNECGIYWQHIDYYHRLIIIIIPIFFSCNFARATTHICFSFIYSACRAASLQQYNIQDRLCNCELTSGFMAC